eukprot:scaffold132346_cov66-Phaeocystis_antarctica.AAC.2
MMVRRHATAQGREWTGVNRPLYPPKLLDIWCPRAVAGWMSQALVDAVRRLHLADPDLGLKPLLAKLQEQQPDLGAATREVREALTALKAEESEAAKAAAAQPAADKVVPPAADEGNAPPVANEG